MRDDLIVAAVVLTRLVLGLFIARYPLPAIVGSLVVDALDQTIFQTFTRHDLTGYQTYDKALDVYYLTLAYLSTIRNWAGGPDFAVGRFLWYYRLLGVAIFEYTSAGWVLLAFPNTFEYFFIALEWYKRNRDPNQLTLRQVVRIAAVIWIVVKLPQEWWIHVANLDVTDFVKRRILGAGDNTGWATAITDHLLAAAALVVAVCAIAALVSRLARRLPTPHWPTTYDADHQGALLGWRPPRREARPRAFFGWAFAEKVVLVSMVSIIFARILPGADGRITTVVLVTAYLITMNTVLSQLLARRGTSWRNTATQLVFMALANLAVMTLTAAVVDRGNDTPLRTTLFLVGLLTLIVGLYDRSHGIFADQQNQRVAQGHGGGVTMVPG